jgi:hypothetical protein
VEAELRREQAAATLDFPDSDWTLADELERPEDDDEVWTLEGLQHSGTNLLLAAQFKTGKTTFGLNLLKALADDGSFLGRFPAYPAGRVGYWNYELTAAQWRSWVRRIGIEHPKGASALHLRGHRLPLIVPEVADWAVDWLRSRDIAYWIIDPFHRAFGGDENSNERVGEWLDAVDEIKRRARVDDLLLIAHTGRKEHEPGEEHARGATRLDDWADVRLILTKERGGDYRFFRAHGRGIDVPESRLDFDPETLALTVDYQDPDDRGADREGARLRTLKSRILEAVATNPGMLSGDIRRLRGRADDIVTALRELVADGELVQRARGQAREHYLPHQAEGGEPHD